MRNEKYAQIIEEWEMDKYKNGNKILEEQSVYDPNKEMRREL
jgi:hypothetical protein